MLNFKTENLVPRLSKWLSVESRKKVLISQNVRAIVETFSRTYATKTKTVTDYSYQDLWDLSGFDVATETSQTLVVEFATIAANFTIRRYLLDSMKGRNPSIVAATYVAPLRVDNLLVASSMLTEGFSIATSSFGPFPVAKSVSTTPLPWIGPIATERMLCNIASQILDSDGNMDAVGLLKRELTSELTAFVAQPLVEDEQNQWKPLGDFQQSFCCLKIDADVQDLFVNNELVVLPRMKADI